ncbi:MAG: hypothetical protein Tsb009_37740 [Planctomycetaceae bacterium]
MATLLKRTYTKVDPKTGERIRKKTRKWYGQFVDADGTTKRVPLCKDKSAAQAMLTELVKQVERKQAGIVDNSMEHTTRPLKSHLQDFRSYLSAQNNTAKHVRQTCNRIQKLIEGCGFMSLADVSASNVVSWLGDQREQGVFGIKTSNYYLGAIKEFCNWLVRENRLPHNPLSQLNALNADSDIRRERRALTADELAKLITSAKTGGVVEGMTGMDRAMLYLLAAWTGFRRSELASLMRQSFDLESVTPTITVAAGYSKRRRKDTLPLHLIVVEELRAWLDTKADIASNEILFPVANRKTSKMMRLDLERVGIAYRDEQGRVADFHANRHTFISNLSKAGVAPKTAQTLARHSDINLTMGVYSHVELADQAAALNSVASQNMTPDVRNSEPNARGDEEWLALRLALKSDISCPESSDAVPSTSQGSGESKMPKPLDERDLGTDCHALTVNVRSSGGGTRTPDTRIMIPLL